MGSPATQLFARYRNGPLTCADLRRGPCAHHLSPHENSTTDARVPGTVPGPGSILAPDPSSHSTASLDTLAALPLLPPGGPSPVPTPPLCWRDGCDTISPDTTPRQTWLHTSPPPRRSCEYRAALCATSSVTLALFPVTGKCRLPASSRPSRLLRGHFLSLPYRPHRTALRPSIATTQHSSVPIGIDANFRARMTWTL